MPVTWTVHCPHCDWCAGVDMGGRSREERRYRNLEAQVDLIRHMVERHTPRHLFPLSELADHVKPGGWSNDTDERPEQPIEFSPPVVPIGPPLVPVYAQPRPMEVRLQEGVQRLEHDAQGGSPVAWQSFDDVVADLLLEPEALLDAVVARLREQAQRITTLREQTERMLEVCRTARAAWQLWEQQGIRLSRCAPQEAALIAAVQQWAAGADIASMPEGSSGVPGSPPFAWTMPLPTPCGPCREGRHDHCAIADEQGHLCTCRATCRGAAG